MKWILPMFLLAIGCKDDDPHLPLKCEFTFQGKSYSGVDVTCSSIPDPEWNPSSGTGKEGYINYYSARPAENDLSWELTVSDGQDWGEPTVTFYEESHSCAFNLFSGTATVKRNGGTVTFTASGFTDFFGNPCEGELKGTCNCTPL